MKDKKIEKLKAEVDFYKTWTTLIFASLISSSFGYWVIRKEGSMTVYSTLSLNLVFSVGLIVFAKKYIGTHDKLIDEISK